MSNKIKLFAMDYYNEPREIISSHYGYNGWICGSCGTSSMTFDAYIKNGNRFGITILLEDVEDIPIKETDQLHKIETKNGVLNIITAS